MTLDELIAALEKATGPSIYLSWVIAGSPKFEDGTANLNVPHCTGSLDTALTLVPEGMFWSVDSSGSAFVCDLDSEKQRGSVRTGDAATPAIAICIAALKARKK